MRINTYHELLAYKLESLLPDLEAGHITAFEFRKTIRRIAHQLRRGLSANATVSATRVGRRMRSQRGEV